MCYKHWILGSCVHSLQQEKLTPRESQALQPERRVHTETKTLDSQKLKKDKKIEKNRGHDLLEREDPPRCSLALVVITVTRGPLSAGEQGAGREDGGARGLGYPLRGQMPYRVSPTHNLLSVLMPPTSKGLLPQAAHVLRDPGIHSTDLSTRETPRPRIS